VRHRFAQPPGGLPGAVTGHRENRALRPALAGFGRLHPDESEVGQPRHGPVDDRSRQMPGPAQLAGFGCQRGHGKAVLRRLVNQGEHDPFGKRELPRFAHRPAIETASQPSSRRLGYRSLTAGVWVVGKCDIVGLLNLEVM